MSPKTAGSKTLNGENDGMVLSEIQKASHSAPKVGQDFRGKPLIFDTLVLQTSQEARHLPSVHA